MTTRDHEPPADPSRSLAVSEAADWHSIMQKGSKTFSLAAKLFDRSRREGAQLLYAWCRYCDDAIDSAPTPEAAIRALNQIRAQTHLALESEQAAAGSAPPFRALALICSQYQIPAIYPLELINGMEMDTNGVRIETTRDLELYCYRVASVVGLMMSHIMGVSDPRALRHAVDTGLAMQMTNIARDIHDDFLMKRIYLPTEWFREFNIARPDVENGAIFQARDFLAVTQTLLSRADRYYVSGQMGLSYLPWRAAFAVSMAQLAYREIGVRVRARGPQAWESRTVIGLGRKLVLMIKAIFIVIKSKAVSRHPSNGRLQLRDHLFCASDL